VVPTHSPASRARWLGVAVAVLAAVAVVVVVLLVSRGGSAAADVQVSGHGAPRVGQVPPQFSGTTIDGSRFDLAAERGHTVLINFFATWCDNCRAELPLLQRTWTQRHGQGLDIVTVDFNDGGDARAFLRSNGVSFPALLDPSSAVGHAYLVSDLPVSFFVGRDGRIASVFHGQLSDATLAEQLRGLM
jgi:peroxiredoxin